MLIILIFLAFTILGAAFVLMKIQMVKSVAIRDHKKEVPLFGGLLRLLLWEPNEGLVILKDKKIGEIIPSGEVRVGQQGGMKFISALRGEELRARIPLTLRLMTWEDQNVLTRESIRVQMKVALWWQVRDLSSFVFSINTGINVDETHYEVGLLVAAEAWLRTMTESTLRTLVSRQSIAFLVSSRATSYLQVANLHDKNADLSLPPEAGNPESLATELCTDLTQKVLEYGFMIQRVEIQEISLSREIQEAIDRVWSASLLPAQTEQEARAKQIELEGLAKVIGVDATAMNVLLKNLKGVNIYGTPPLLDALFQQVGKSPGRREALGGQGDASRLPAETKTEGTIKP